MRLATLFTVILLAACAKHDETVPDSATTTVPPRQATLPAAPPRGTSTPPPCPGTGKWALCNVERRLKQSGFVVTPVEGEAPARPGFSVKPRVYKLGKARLEVFLYDTEAAVTRDVAQLDTAIAAPKGSASPWEMPPIFMRSQNLAAVLLTENARQAERVVLAITAGAPQPGSPR